MNKLTKTIILLFATTATSATASTVVDSFNETATPVQSFFSAEDWGWFYRPSVSYNLNGIRTNFSTFPDIAPPTPKTVTLEVLTAPRSDGGTLLGSASFDWTTARGTLNGPSFSDIPLTAGITYFIGFRNIYGIGVNIANSGTQAIPGVSRFDIDGSGSYNQQQTDPVNSFPILQFTSNSAVVPIPAAFWLFGSAITGLLVSVRKKGAPKP